MLVKLTTDRIDRTPPDPAKDVFLWDSAVTGFGVKVAKKGRNFVIQYRNARHKSRRLTFSTTALSRQGAGRGSPEAPAGPRRDRPRDGSRRAGCGADPRRTHSYVAGRICRQELDLKPSWPNTKSEVKQLQAWLGEWLVTSITRRPPFFGERHRREAGEDMGTGRGKRRTARPRDISGEGVPSI
jgi:hypothetical protein